MSSTSIPVRNVPTTITVNENKPSNQWIYWVIYAFIALFIVWIILFVLIRSEVIKPGNWLYDSTTWVPGLGSNALPSRTVVPPPIVSGGTGTGSRF